MKRYVKNKSKYTSSETQCINKEWITRYFCLYCDICGKRYSDIPVDKLCEEQSLPDGDYCWNCLLSAEEQELFGKARCVYFLEKSHNPAADRKYFLKEYAHVIKRIQSLISKREAQELYCCEIHQGVEAFFEKLKRHPRLYKYFHEAPLSFLMLNVALTEIGEIK